jgi:hypothetical protein
LLLRRSIPLSKKYGNISSASIPVAMDDAYRKKRLNKGDNLVLVGFGGRSYLGLRTCKMEQIGGSYGQNRFFYFPGREHSISVWAGK